MRASQLRLVTGDEPTTPQPRKHPRRTVAARIISEMTIRVLGNGEVQIGKQLDDRNLTLIMVKQEDGELIGHRRHHEVADQFIGLWRWATETLDTTMGELVLAAIEMSTRVQDTSLTYTGTQAWLYWANSMREGDLDAGQEHP